MAGKNVQVWTPARQTDNSLRQSHSLRNSALALCSLLIVCAAVRVWLVAHTDIIARDSRYYMATVNDFVQDPMKTCKTARTPPGYPAAIVAMHRLLVSVGASERQDTWDLSGQLVSLLASLAATAAIWLFAAKAFDRRSAWIAALLSCVARKWAMLGSDALTDALAVALELWALMFALWALDRIREARPRAALPAAFTGLLAGMGFLVRPEALIALGLSMALWTFASPRRGHWKQKFLCLACAGTMAMVLLVPYVVITGRLTNKIEIFSTSPEASAPAAGDAAPPSADPTPPRSSVVAKLLQMPVLLMEIEHPVLAILTIIALAAYLLRYLPGLGWLGDVLPRTHKPAVFLILGTAAILTPLVAMNYIKLNEVSSRYFLLLAAMLWSLSGVGARVVVRVVRQIILAVDPESLFIAAAGPLIVSAIFAGLTFHCLRPLHEGKGGYRMAGEFLGAQMTPDDTCLVDETRVLHYASDRGDAFAPRRSAADLTEAIRRCAAATRGRVFVVMGNNTFFQNPSLAQLAQQPGWVEVACFPTTLSKQGEIVHVYRLDSPAATRPANAVTQPAPGH